VILNHNEIQCANIYDVVYSYSESHRAYHNLEHIVSMLDELERHNFSLRHPQTFKFAIWFHDIVYETKPNDRDTPVENERKSAEVAVEEIRKLGLPESLGIQAAELIMVTTHQAESVDPEAQFLADIDLVTLGQSERNFNEYEKNIRTEYSWVPAEDYRAGRLKVLQSFLTRPFIYSSQVFREKYEIPARRNLQHSVSLLSK
jgi:predicted metal-dependent HD superfamily phosphohydrolase